MFDELEQIDKEIHILRERHEKGEIDDDKYNVERRALTDRYVECVNNETAKATERIREMHRKLDHFISSR